jgi:glycosyltransferase involved in cell wall biosynthesis
MSRGENADRFLCKRRPLKIMLVNTLYPPEIMGGAEVSVSLLARALVRMGHQVTAVCLHRAAGQSVDEVDGVRIYRLPIDNAYWPFGQTSKPSAWRRLGWHVRDTWNRGAARRFGKILDAETPDVVHTNNLTGFSVSLWAEAKQRRIRVVHTLRDYSLLCRRATLFRNGATCDQRCSACYTLTIPYLYSSHLVDAVASNSRFVLDQHQKRGYFAGIPDRVIYNIADPTGTASPSNSPSDDLVFGFIGRLENEKGIQIILRAVELLPDTGWRLRIAGKGLEHYVQQLKAGCTNPRVEWLGFTKPQDFYASIDVCLVSSVWPEPLPRTLIESISAGRATICSTAGGIPEISGMSALVGTYEPNDHQKLAELMRKAISETTRWKRIQPVQPEFLDKFSPTTIGSQYLEIYTAKGSGKI